MGVGLLLLSLSLTAAPKLEWLPISPAELAETSSPTNPDVPAEILYRRIESDQRGVPFERAEREYLRYKIYNPEKSDAYTRISRFDPSGLYSYSSMDYRDEIQARLTLPDGTTRLFTKADIKERAVQKSAYDNSLLGRLFGQTSEVKEKFLAVTGVVPGAILEFQIVNEIGFTGDVPDYIFDWAKRFYEGEARFHSLQHPDLPVRKVEFVGRLPRDDKIPCNYFTLNSSIGAAVSNANKKAGTFTLTATNLPPTYREPMAGPGSFYSLTILESLSNADAMRVEMRQSKQIRTSVNTQRDGVWSPVAATAYIEWEDGSEVTAKVKALAQQITAAAKTPLEKAQLIHAHVQKAYQAHRRKPQPKGEVIRVKKMDDIVTHETQPNLRLEPNDFLFLANALYKAAGFETRGMLFPDRSRNGFNVQLAVKALMPHWAAAVKIDGEWKYSMPQSTYVVSFGSLPWFCERQKGLVIKVGSQELIDSPAGKSADARIINTAELTLSEQGVLSGQAKRTYHGHHAYTIRSQVKTRTGASLNRFLQRLIEDDFKEITRAASVDEQASSENEGAEGEPRTPGRKSPVQITNVKGIKEGGGPVEVEYKLNLPGYAQIVGDRLLFRAAVFRSGSQHPFAATTRTTAVRIPYAWQEIDQVKLTYPTGYVLEKTDAASLPSGSVLHFVNKVQDDPAAHLLTCRREFATELTLVAPEYYAAFKRWNDELVSADRHQFVLTKAPVSTP